MITVGTGLVASLDNAMAAEICQTRSDTVALTRAKTTADQSVTLLETLLQAVASKMSRKQRAFL